MTSPAQNPHFYPPKYDQRSSSYIAPPPMSLPFSSPHYDSHVYTRYPEMTLPIAPTSEETVMASSCKAVQELYMTIVAKQKDYQKCQGPYIGQLENEDFFEWGSQRAQRLKIEGQFPDLALKVQELHGQSARGAIFLKEKICDIASTITSAIDKDISHLEHCLKNDDCVLLRDEHASLVTRIKIFATMEKLFGSSEFTLSSGRVCSFPSDVTMLKRKVNDLKHKLPDSEFVQGLKSFFGGISAVFTPAPKDNSVAHAEFLSVMRAYKDPLFVAKLSRSQREISDHASRNMTTDAWARIDRTIR